MTQRRDQIRAADPGRVQAHEVREDERDVELVRLASLKEADGQARQARAGHPTVGELPGKHPDRPQSLSLGDEDREWQYETDWVP